MSEARHVAASIVTELRALLRECRVDDLHDAAYVQRRLALTSIEKVRHLVRTGQLACVRVGPSAYESQPAKRDRRSYTAWQDVRFRDVDIDAFIEGRLRLASGQEASSTAAAPTAPPRITARRSGMSSVDLPGADRYRRGARTAVKRSGAAEGRSGEGSLT